MGEAEDKERVVTEVIGLDREAQGLPTMVFQLRNAAWSSERVRLSFNIFFYLYKIFIYFFEIPLQNILAVWFLVCCIF